MVGVRLSRFCWSCIEFKGCTGCGEFVLITGCRAPGVFTSLQLGELEELDPDTDSGGTVELPKAPVCMLRGECVGITTEEFERKL